MCEEFLLKWNDHQTSFSSMMKSICLKEEMTDCTISNGSKLFYAHRMVLSTCSPYMRSLFSSIPSSQHPIIFIKDIEDGIVELLVKYMYSGEISVSQDQLIPLVQAAKSLAIKGLLDVPVPTNDQDEELKPPVLKKAKMKLKSQVTHTNSCDKKQVNDLENAQAPVGGRPTVKHEARQSRGSFVRPKDDVSTSPTSKDNVTTTATAGRELGTVYKKADLPGLSLSASVVKEEVDTAVKEELGIVDDVSPDEEDTGPDFDFKNQHELLQRLTSEMTAYPVMGEAAPLTIYACQHCGKEFSSKRKHQRHVLNVHFGYNPVQCPFCEKGHRDNYNLKQHVCPVLNMKYGNFQTKDNKGVDNT